MSFLKSIFLFAAFCVTLFVMPQQTNAARAFYVFGDSLVDSGNNNYLVTTARADSPPYGIDYPTGRPTGRFSNGLNLPDIVSEQIGSEPTLPILSPELTGEKLLIGANFASAGIGILNDTGIQFLNILRIGRQFELFQEYQERVSAIIGSDKTQQLVSGALVLMTLGGNDFVNNYFLPFSSRGRQSSLGEFSQLLISEYKKILARLYELGARRVMVTGTGPLGCVPSQLASSGSVNGECAPEAQQAAAIFNPLLNQMLQGLNREIGSDVFIGANAFNMNADFINNPQRFGFVTSKVACCGQGAYNGQGVCTPLSSLCPDRNAYAFWDPFHPTEKATRLIVQQIMTGSVEYMNPMNLSTIMALDSRI
uniref:GDSL esterase/lipase n=1 Tax=Noccaea caerulescens TaxID=107243 RepID=A0A1J3DDU8_NOCCA